MTARTRRGFARTTALAVGLVLFAAGCGGGGGNGGDSGLKVVATTTQVADFVREVGGDQVSVTQVLQPNTDPHQYEPRPADVQAFADAKLVFRSGGHLDEWAADLVEDSGSQAEIVDLSDGLPVELRGGHDHSEEGHTEDEGADGHGEDDSHAQGEDHGHGHADDDGHGHADDHGHGHADDDGHGHADDDHGHDEKKDRGGEKQKQGSGRAEPEGDHAHDEEEVDPHWWHDPVNVKAAVGTVATALAEADPAAEADFQANAEAYDRELARLNRSIAKCVDSLAPDERKLVTDHDAFGYFTERYGLETVGTVIPALTTEAQPSAGDLAELEDTIRDEKVKAIFPESSVSKKLADAIAADTGASTDHVLYGDTLGPADSDGSTYLEMMQANANSVMLGLTGGDRGCELESQPG